jgi:hypothetical protein
MLVWEISSSEKGDTYKNSHYARQVRRVQNKLSKEFTEGNSAKNQEDFMKGMILLSGWKYRKVNIHTVTA